MARAQTSAVVAFSTGRTIVDPGRFKNRGTGAKGRRLPPLGDPPWEFDLQQRAAWGDTVATMWWLDEGDRHSVAAYCRIKVMIEDPDTRMDAALWGIYIRLLALLGGAPTTRGKLLQERNLGGGDDDADTDI